MPTEKSQIGDLRNNGTMRRVEEGEERRRAAVLPGTMSIAVADLYFSNRVSLVGEREIGNLLPNNRRQRRTCYALCNILYPVSAAHTSIFRMDSNSTSYRWGKGKRFKAVEILGSVLGPKML